MRFRRSITGLVMVGLLAVTYPAPAGADTLDDLRDKRAAAQRERDAANKQIAALEEELEDTDAQMAAAYVRLQEIEAQLPVAQAALDEAQATLIVAQREADALAERLQDAEAEGAALEVKIAQSADDVATTRSNIAELARRAYRGEGSPDGMSMIVGAESAQDFVERYSLSQAAMRAQTTSLSDLQQVEATSRNTEVRLEAVREAVAELKSEADAAVVAAEEARVEAEAERQAVENLLAEQQQQTAVIESRKAAQEQAKAQKEQAADALSNDIQRLIGLTEKEKARIKAEERRKRLAAEKAARERAASRDNDREEPVPPAPPATSSFLAYPTKNVYITSKYGYRLHPVLGYMRLHAGTDFRAYCGTPIYASAAGKVQWTTYRAGYGNQVLVDHGRVGGSSLMTSYNHLSRYGVNAGQSVQKGQLVGYSGNTGTGTACHLHFEVYVNGVTVNPMSML